MSVRRMRAGRYSAGAAPGERSAPARGAAGAELPRRPRAHARPPALLSRRAADRSRAPSERACAMSARASLSDFCRRLLESPALEAKLVSPRLANRALPPDARSAAPAPPRPARAPGIAFERRAPALPRPGQLGSAAARAACLARFAHHELCAVELLAWALLRWPDAPAGLRRSWALVLEDEQRHCRAYLERLAAHGSRLEAHPASGYFWRVAELSGASAQGPRAFLAALGLTLEQGNLDFSALYADAFLAGGDRASAAVCRRVQRDEI